MERRLLLFMLVGALSSSLIPTPAKATEYFDANNLDKVIQDLQRKVAELQVNGSKCRENTYFKKDSMEV